MRCNNALGAACLLFVSRLLRVQSGWVPLLVGQPVHMTTLPEGSHSGFWRDKNIRPLGSLLRRACCCRATEPALCDTQRTPFHINNMLLGDPSRCREPQELMQNLRRRLTLLGHCASSFTSKAFRIVGAKHLAASGPALAQILAAGDDEAE